MSFDLDLDALARPDLRVKLDGREWRLPGGPKSQTVVDMAAAFTAFDVAIQAGEQEKTKQISDEIREMFADLFGQREQAEGCYVDGELDLPELTDEQMAALFELLVNQVVPRGEGEGARPTSSTAPKSKSAKRSPRSSSRRRQPASSTS